MLKVFGYAFNAIAPILMMVLLGYFLQARKIYDRSFFKTLNAFAFHYCFPPLMFTNLYALSGISEIRLGFLGFVMGMMVLITFVSVGLAHILTSVRNRRGVLIQAGFRANYGTLAIPLVEGLCGASGVAVATSVQAPTVIYFNIVAVLVLAIYSENAEVDPAKIARNLLKNPMIQGLSAGVIALFIREWIPVGADGSMLFSLKRDIPFLYTGISYLSRLATPLSLIALGGQFRYADMANMKKEIVGGVLMRLVMAPAIGLSAAFLVSRSGLFAMSPAVVSTLIAVFGAPISTSSAVMAAEMQGDEALANQIVVWTSMFSMLTIFLMAAFFRAIGYL